MLQEMKVPQKALQFVEHDNTVVELIAADLAEGSSKSRSAVILGYSGGVIDHWYWGRLGINTKGIKFKKSTYPVLEDHYRDRKVGFSKKPVIDAGALKLPSVTLLNTEAALEFIKLSGDGFPYEASISIVPTTIKRFDKPTDIELNGRTLKNLDVVIDASIYKETSICVFGADSDTESILENSQQDLISFKADCEGFTHTENNVSKQESEVKKMEKMEMSVAQFKETYPDILASLTAEFSEKASKETLELSTKIEQLSTAVKELGTSVVTLTAENGKLQKQNQETAERQASFDRKTVVAGIWEVALSASKLPAKVHDKVKLIVSETAFVKDGQLDTAAFTAAVAAEVADWESRDITAGASDVIGFGSAGQPVVSATAATAESKLVSDTVKSMSRFLDKSTLKKAVAA